MIAINLRSNPFKKATDRARADKGYKVVMREFGRYFVIRPDRFAYVVHLGVKPNGQKVASCDCAAGRVNQLCKHVAMAAPLHVYAAKNRQQ